jgi:hypothetical protein
MGPGAGERGNPLHEVENAFRLSIFLAKSRFDNLRGL